MRAEHDTSAEALVPRVCAKCGKVFTPAPYHQFVSYRTHGQTTRKQYFCKWSCYNHRNDPTDKRSAKGKKVLMYDPVGNFIGEFDNAKQAALKLTEAGVNAEGRYIQRVCRGELPHYHGYIFKYKE